ncbi:MAG: helix-hairpin-helix domain-containing protein [Acidobacteriota bacterium]|nr:helix-hairpin-helix domain-containing protein [Acidobacteriota bacterium]
MSLDRKTAARVLREAAALLEVQGENIHRIRALTNASRIVERIDGDLEALVESGEILEIKGVGKGTAAILRQLSAGERPEILADAERVVPFGVREMLTIPGLGPKKVRALWRDLGLVSIGELEYACRENRLVELPGFGARTQEKLIEAIRFSRMADERRLINQAWREATELTSSLSAVDGVEKALVGGEVRRRCETVGSLVIVVVAADEASVAHALSDLLSRVERESRGRICGVTEGGLPVKVAVVSAAEAAAAVLWSTGSDGHLHALAEHALSIGLRLNESGLWRGDGRVECADERALYEALGCQWVAPELREGEGEVARAVAGTLPELVDLEDLLGVLHNHTTDSDGVATVEEMAAAARGLGWSFFGVADHSPVASYANGVSAERLREQWRCIDELNTSVPGFRIVKGIEADILTDGSLDIPEGCEEGLEYVVASVHSAFRLTEEAQTERLVRAVTHPACRILGHPTGRLLLARPGYALDLDTVLLACAEHGVAVEINASPYRLDIDWRWARRALDLGLKLAVNPDAHSTQGFEDVRWGVAVARKAGATKADLINCSDIDDFLNSR